MTAPLFNRDALLPGMDISRMTPALISKGIVLRTQGWRVLRAGTGLSHDAKLIRCGSQWYVGDAHMGKVAQMTPLEKWEDDMRRGKARVVVYRPVGVTKERMAASAWYWQTEISGQKMYDAKAIRHLLFFYATAELLNIRLGDEGRVYCTVSIHAPRAGRDRPLPVGRAGRQSFNPRAPRGARRARGWRRRKARPVSIHAPRAGRDAETMAAMAMKASFNPRAPRGARPPKPSTCVSPCGFNPRAPRGARPGFPRMALTLASFNPRAPRGARRCDSETVQAGDCFNPRAPRGARLWTR